MKKRLTALAPYAAVLAVNFYALPLLAKDTGTAMLMMLCIMPLITSVSSLTSGAKHGFDWLPPIIAVVLFAPTIPIYYNGSAWVYVIAHGIISLAGSGVGGMLHGRK